MIFMATPITCFAWGDTPWLNSQFSDMASPACLPAAMIPEDRIQTKCWSATILSNLYNPFNAPVSKGNVLASCKSNKN